AGELPESARKAVAAASAEIARLDRLVSDLLLVAGNKLGPRSAVGVGALVRGVKLEASGDGDADIDAESVARAIDNLVRNAVEASPAEGTVEVRVGDTAEAVLVQIEDHGAGVEPARAAELFEP